MTENSYPPEDEGLGVIRPRLSDREYSQSGPTGVAVHENGKLLRVIECGSGHGQFELMRDMYYGEYDGG